MAGPYTAFTFADPMISGAIVQTCSPSTEAQPATERAPEGAADPGPPAAQVAAGDP
jgi:hypothetical protein